MDPINKLKQYIDTHSMMPEDEDKDEDKDKDKTEYYPCPCRDMRCPCGCGHRYTGRCLNKDCEACKQDKNNLKSTN